MDILLRAILIILRLFRYALDLISEVVFGWFYQGKHERLPPIKSQYLLEPANVLAAKIRRHEVKSTDIVKAYIQRIRDVQPVINAIVEERFAEALEEAKYIDDLLQYTSKTEEELAEETPLLGIPITVKEAIAVKGCLFTVGLPARKGFRATSDSDAVALLKRAGAIPIAVTITPELCFWWESYNTLYGRCCNPYDTTRTSGGSSGGEGSILGSAGSVIGVGNDIGGSIRIPASFNGVFGHKPSRGVVSNGGQYPTAAPPLQTFLMTGPMCRYASDLLPMLKILAVDHASKLKLDEKVHFENIKLYYMENDGGNPLISSVNPEITKAQKKVIDYFAVNYGVFVQKVELPTMKHSFEIWSKIITTSDMRPITEEMTGRCGEVNLSLEFLKWLFGISDHILPVLCSAVLNKALAPKDEKQASKFYKMLYLLETQFEEILGSNGVFIYPTGPDFAPYHGQALLKPFNVSYTAIFNLLGFPVSQCPITISSKGLPIGLQIVSGLYNDHITIAVAEELEKAFGGWVNPSTEIS
ncbi:fatty-acid amide hydrolase 2-like [Stegodyphus dumicola]|uniref:fatty-acid amide hydrolase 2-like n=1 Tax=Stegodyphus dumicola TaxID=202533 RepID=UPI0015A96E6C|nr:fatty-acid amide hydrolase 2-like [Stegodyphus dumicola]